MAQAERSLARILQHWMHSTRLRQYEVARLAGLSRQYFSMIYHGRIRRPAPGVLRAIARALATDPDGRVDDEQRRLILRELSEAAGFEDLSTDRGPSSLREAILAAGANPQSAAFHEWFVRTYPDLGPAQQLWVRTVLEMFAKHGGEVTDSLLRRAFETLGV